MTNLISRVFLTSLLESGNGNIGSFGPDMRFDIIALIKKLAKLHKFLFPGLHIG